MAAGAGAALAFAADFRIGGPSTGFLMAFAGVGLAADSGASWTLQRLVGYAKATELLLLAQPIDVTEADRLGLLTQVVSTDDEVLTAAQALADRLAAGPTVAYREIKASLAYAATATLSDALEREAEAQAVTGVTADHRNATAAFVAKRERVFSGR
jgi:2-(1,2-epoxy-1,2-dihydrophenyl)acetyl-CoA isomerase